MKPTDSPETEPVRSENTRQTLIDAAFDVVREQGRLDALSVREVARRAGLSSAAPFKHFKNRQNLITAMATIAAADLRTAFEQATRAMDTDRPPLDRFAALGRAYIQWAMREPVLFSVLNDAGAATDESANAMHADNEAVYRMMQALLQPVYGQDAQRMALTLLGARALVYGLARLAADGQLRNWAPTPESTLALQEAVVNLFTQHMAASAGAPGPLTGSGDAPVPGMTSPVRGLL